jgi:hypothetical protein
MTFTYTSAEHWIKHLYAIDASFIKVFFKQRAGGAVNPRLLFVDLRIRMQTRNN